MVPIVVAACHLLQERRSAADLKDAASFYESRLGFCAGSKLHGVAVWFMRSSRISIRVSGPAGVRVES